MPRVHHNKKRNRPHGNKGNHGPPNKKRRFDNPPSTTKLSPQEQKNKCLNIIKKLQETLKNETIELMTLLQFTESDVGIQTFIDDESKSKTHKPIIANLKHKYEDFIVSEIDESGNVIKLTNNTSIKDEHSINKDASISQSINNVYEQLSTLINQEKAQNFIKWYKNCIQSKHNINIDTGDATNTTDKKENDNNIKQTTKKFVFDANKDKQERTAIHKLLRNLQYTASKTNDSSCIEVDIIKGKFAKQRWPRSRGAYLKFVLTKCGMDNSKCLSKITAKLYKNSTKTFSIAGTKDKHAVTSQNVTAFHVSCDELKNAVSGMSNVRVGNFEYVSDEIKLGCLLGNEFHIALRNVSYFNEEKEQKLEVKETELKERLDILSNIGFINYFGMQRFGSSRVGTHFIGRAIVANKLCFALALLILPRAGESEEYSKKRNEFICSGDVSTFPYKLYAEKKCIYGLLEDEHNYQQIFMKIPRNIRTMYVHAYQSFIWNHCVSQRINKYGYKAVIGDIVRLKNKGNTFSEDINSDFEYLTKENMDKYDIFDVVFPLASPNIMLPKLTDMVEFMDDLLKKDGLTLQSFNNLDPRVWGINTGYRNILVKAKDIKGVVKQYESDEQLLINVPFESNTNNNNKEQDDDGQKKIAWIVSFQLQKSCYATMCLRQLLFIASDKLKR